MFSVTDLSEEQIEQIKVWTSEGDQLADLQRKINSEFKLESAVTYMDTRFAIIDLGIELVLAAEPEEEKQDEPKPLTPLGYVDAKVDTIVRPGFLASGTVIFSDGVNALWGLDQEGRLKLDADDPSYQVEDEDMVAFQEILRDKLKA
jgi:hypothetical protein|tara:strand:+ start:6406 stop:6846 length:441 start_codon:yes stop_codon:yes gene_type:complete